MTEPMLSVALDGAVSHIGIGTESLGIGQEDSLEGRGGPTPRPATPRRLYRGLRAATDIPLARPAGPGWEPLSRRRRTYFRVYPLPLQSPIPGVSAVHDRAYALRSDG